MMEADGQYVTCGWPAVRAGYKLLGIKKRTWLDEIDRLWLGQMLGREWELEQHPPPTTDIGKLDPRMIAEAISMRDSLNILLNQDHSALDEQFRKGMLSTAPGFDWLNDPLKSDG